MDPELQSRIINMESRIEAIYVSVEKTRKYFLWTMIGSIVIVVIPIIGLALAIPALLSSLSGLGGL